MFERFLFRKGTPIWHSYKAKIASTLFAIVVWFLIVTEGTFDHDATIPIEMPKERESLIVTSILPEYAKVRIRGKGLAIITFLLFREGWLQLKPHWQAGNIVLHPTREDVVLIGSAKDLTLVELIEPESIPVKIEELAAKSIPIKNQIDLKPRAGYTIVAGIIFDPSCISIEGPKDSLDRCESVLTETKAWHDLTRPFRKQVALLAPEISQVRLLESKTWFSVDVQKLVERQIRDVAVAVINLPPDVKALVMPSRLSLVVEGGAKVVSSVTAKDINAYIDLHRYSSKDGQDYFAYIEPLPEIRFRDIEPKHFKVVYERE
jgi:hypothetical protein